MKLRMVSISELTQAFSLSGPCSFPGQGTGRQQTFSNLEFHGF